MRSPLFRFTMEEDTKKQDMRIHRDELGYGVAVSICTLIVLALWPDLLTNLLVGNGFIPHGHCYLWKPNLVWLHVVSDFLIGLAYVSISGTLSYLVYKARRDIPFYSVFLAFGLFIIACGATHFIEIWTLWHPMYWLSGSIKLITAIVSVTTALLLPPLVPQVIALVAAAKSSNERKLQLETANQELETLYQKLKELDQLKTQFFANVSHDLRTPLTLILGPTEKLLADSQSTSIEQRHNLEVVNRNAQILLKRVNDLLDVSKLEAGKMEINYAPTDVAQLVRLTGAYFEILAQERKVAFSLETPPSLQATVDADKLQRICFNLLSNAFKFTPLGGSIRCILGESVVTSSSGQLKLSGSSNLTTLQPNNLKTPTDCFILTVQDSGLGVPLELREVIFEPFRQRDLGSNQLFGGTGLGLAIVKEFVELHGGTITTGDASGGGAIFTVCIPKTASNEVLSFGAKELAENTKFTDNISTENSNQTTTMDGEFCGLATGDEGQGTGDKGLETTDRGQDKTFSSSPIPIPNPQSPIPNPQSPIPNPQSPIPNPQSPIPNPQSPLVLVVEDNPEMNQFIAEILARKYRVVTARNGHEGLDKAIALSPDLILTDVMMPHLNGEQLVRKVRSITALDGIPIILLTAKADDKLRVQMLREGAQDYLMKPFQIEELQARVDNAIAIKQVREVLQTELQILDGDVAVLANEVANRKRELQKANDELEIRVTERTRELLTANELLKVEIASHSLAEESLRASEKRFRSYFELPLVGIAITSPEKGWLEVNDKLCEFLGYSRQELREVTWEDLTHPDDLQPDLDQFNKVLAGETEGYLLDKRFIRKDGTVIHTSISIRCVRRADKSIDYFIAVLQDITLALQALESLRQSESTLRSFFDSAPLMMGIVELVDDDILHISDNRTSSKLFETTPEAMRNQKASSLGVPPKYLRLWCHQYQLAQRSQAPVHFEYPHKIGRNKKWLSATVCPIEVSTLARPRFAYVVEDITNRKQAEKERLQLSLEHEARVQAQEQQQRYQLMAETVPQIVWTAGPDGAVDYFNQRWTDYTGMTLEESLGWQWQPVLHPDDRNQNIERWLSAVDTGETHEIECRFKRASDGTYRWHLIRAMPIRDRNGWVVKWFGTCTDIDDQKRILSSMRFLADATVVLTCSLDYHATLQRLVQLVVPHLADWCTVHIKSADGSLRLLEVAHVDSERVQQAWEVEKRYPCDPQMQHGLAKVMQTGVAELVPEIPDSPPDAIAGDENFCSFCNMGFKSYMCLPLVARGTTLGAITFLTAESGRQYNEADLALASELTHRAAMAVDNARLYQEAQEASRMKDEFLAIISHELRTPINSVLAWAQMLKTRKLNEAKTNIALDTIERNAKAQTQLIEDLLDVSLMIRGNLSIDRRPVDLKTVIQVSLNTLLASAQAKGVEIETILDSAGKRVEGDSTRLQQVFSNLISNAIKFATGGDRVTVRLSVENEPEQQTTKYAQIQVSDTGVGISAEFLPHVFDLFRQADSSITRSHGGLGLGLAIVRYLVELHGGTVTAQSPGVGQGATFTVLLPLQETKEVREGGITRTGTRGSDFG
ncbi:MULTISPECIES: ATP-binding protein [Cyanophyceae]|uniref:ATP-binding protein n=1 Tax=Cyanophyceae TaxID=3028117 RepID=UPI0018EFB7C8|nr:ATP-binding protein [Trichocoleus sp. FACHB-69]